MQTKSNAVGTNAAILSDTLRKNIIESKTLLETAQGMV
jgi:hypothetical protein